MDFSKHPIYAADYVSAILISVAFTIIFAEAIRERNYRAWREVPAKIWLLAVGSWMSGFILMWLGAFIARWLPLVAAVVSAVLIAFAAIRAAGFKASAIIEETQPPSGARIAVALYFCVTALLLGGVIFARSYVAGSGEARSAAGPPSIIRGDQGFSHATQRLNSDRGRESHGAA